MSSKKPFHETHISTQEAQSKAQAIAKELQEKARKLTKSQTKYQKTEDDLMLSLSTKLGMDKIQSELKQQAEMNSKNIKLKNNPNFQTQKSYDPFHSPLRFFNANTSTNSYQGIILGPFLNVLGKWANFATDEDCEQFSHYFASKGTDKAKEKTSFPWKAFGKIAASSFGALLRVGASVVDWTVGIVTRPINTVRNLWACIKDPLNASKHINRHYQILETKPTKKPISNSKTSPVGSKEMSIKTMTLNTGLLRDLYWDASKGPLNNLRRPRERALDIAQAILDIAQGVHKDEENDVICLQEVFDNLAFMGLGKDSQSIIIDKLKEKFPYIVYDIGQRAWPMTGSGLMVLSKHPIVDVEFHRYPDLLGIDTLSNKGFVAIKVQKGDRFFTAYNTHTQAGSSDSFRTEWIDQAANKTLATVSTSNRRSQELAYIARHMEVWQTKPPAGNPKLKYLDTVVMGDLNEGLGNANKIYGISHGKKAGRKAGKVKYEGKNLLFNSLSPRLPDNFIDIKIHEPIYIFRQDSKEYILEKIEKDAKGKILSGEKSSIDPVTGIVKNDPLTSVEMENINKAEAGVEALKVTKGVHPLKRQLFDYTLSQLDTTQPIAAKKLREEVFWGSSINKETLIKSLPKDETRAKQEQQVHGDKTWENISELKLLDTNTSRLAHQPDLQRENGVMAVTHYRSHLLHLKSKEDREVTDHLALQMQATYRLDRLS